MIKGRSHFSVSDFVDVVVEQFIDEVHMGQEHPSAAIPIEAQLIQDLANVDSLQRFSVLIPLSDQEAELFPFVGNNLSAAEATHGDDHLLISINYKEIYLLRFQIHKVHNIQYQNQRTISNTQPLKINVILHYLGSFILFLNNNFHEA